MARRLLALIVIAALVACTSSRSSTGALAIQKTGPARASALASLASTEGGHVSWYSTIDAGTTAKLAAAFTAATGIKVDVYRADAPAVLQRLLQEHAAHRPAGDVVDELAADLVTLHAHGALQRYTSPAAAGAPARADWVTDRIIRETVTTNPQVVPSPPAAWEDLGAPALKGKVCIEATDTAWYETLRAWWSAHGVSASAVTARFAAIAANARAITGHSAMGQLLASGECGAAPQFTYITANLMAKGAHLSDSPGVRPAIDIVAGVAVVAGAPHPAAAVMFEDWLLGPGQAILAAAHLDGPRTGTAGDALVDPDAAAANAQAWNDAFQKLLSGSNR